MVCGTPAHVKCYSYHAGTSVIVSGGVGMQQCMIQRPKWNAQTQQSQDWMQIRSYQLNSFRPLFHDKIFSPDTSPTFIPDISLTAVKYPDITRFSRQVGTLRSVLWHTACRYQAQQSQNASLVMTRIWNTCRTCLYWWSLIQRSNIFSTTPSSRLSIGTGSSLPSALATRSFTYWSMHLAVANTTSRNLPISSKLMMTSI